MIAAQHDFASAAHLPPEEEVEAALGLADTDIFVIEEAVRAQDFDVVCDALKSLNALEVADLLGKLSAEDRTELVTYYASLLPAAAFPEMGPDLRRAALKAMTAEEVAAILTDLESDDALDLIAPLDGRFKRKIVRRLSAKLRVALKEGLSFPEDSAGRLMGREFVAVPQFWTTGKTIDYLRAADDTLPDEFFDIFVISPTYQVVGEIPLGRLVRAKRSARLEELSMRESTPIPATMDQEEVAHLFRRKDLTSAPVVDGDGRLIGVVTIDDIIDVIDEEADEDILRMAGVRGQGDMYRAVLSTTGARFGWLAVNLATALLASWVIGFFDETIRKVVALAVLMPVVASMGGNAGMQAATVAVRALAKREISAANRWRIIGKEVLVGLVNGVLFAVITGLVAGWWFSDPWIGIIIGAAMVVTLIVAGFSGAGIPILLARMGADPAVSSTVVLTTVTDIVGFAVFLGLAAVVLL